MPHFKWIAALAAVITLAFGLAAPAAAQVQKSGKATLRRSEHIDITVVRFPGNQFIFGGSITGILFNETDQGFGHNMGVSCAAGGNVVDLAKGVFRPLMNGCVMRDKDGDAYLTEYVCNFSSYDEWCTGRIVAGTGKYSGISGTVRFKPLPGSGTHFRRSCVEAPKADDCKSYFSSAFDTATGVTYHLSGEETAIEEIEWRIP